MAARPSKFKAIVEVNGCKETRESIRDIGYRAAHTRPLMERMVNVLQIQQARRMEAKPFLPLADETIERKSREGESPEVFRDESRMIHGQPTRVPDGLYHAVTTLGSPGQIREVTRASAKFGLDSKGHGKFFYARFVQNVKGKTRKILAISEADALQLTTNVANYLYGGWKRKV